LDVSPLFEPNATASDKTAPMTTTPYTNLDADARINVHQPAATMRRMTYMGTDEGNNTSSDFVKAAEIDVSASYASRNTLTLASYPEPSRERERRPSHRYLRSRCRARRLFPPPTSSPSASKSKSSSSSNGVRSSARSSSKKKKSSSPSRRAQSSRPDVVVRASPQSSYEEEEGGDAWTAHPRRRQSFVESSSVVQGALVVTTRLPLRLRGFLLGARQRRPDADADADDTDVPRIVFVRPFRPGCVAFNTAVANERTNEMKSNERERELNSEERGEE